MKRVFAIGSLLAAAILSPSLFAAQPVQDASVDARLQVISSQLDKTNALLAKLVGEVPDKVAADKNHPDPEVIKALESHKAECSSPDSSSRRFREGETTEVKGKTYKCVSSPHWQEQ